MTRSRALLSVSDKTGLEEFARGLVDLGWEIVSTGGTARTLNQAGIPVRSVSSLTGHPEIMDGRVKTLHPAVHGGLLARAGNARDAEQLDELGYGTIDLVAVNLYPFRETVARGDVPVLQAMDKVDIGGPTMIRAAAKNHERVWVVVDPGDYGRVLDALAERGDRAAHHVRTRRTLAAKVFGHVSGYDQAVCDYLVASGTEARGSGTAGKPSLGDGSGTSKPGAGTSKPGAAPAATALRYGENPDQTASFRPAGDGTHGLAALEQLHGRALSYNNYLDLDGALLSLAPFAFSPDPAVCIVKHTTPCGLSVAASPERAYELALRTDPLSAFGSVIACTHPVDVGVAERMAELFVECVVAPRFTDEALEILTRKKNIRLLVMPRAKPTPTEAGALGGEVGLPEPTSSASGFLALHGRRPHGALVRSVYGGLLEQSPPTPPFLGMTGQKWDVVTQRAPSEDEARDLRFAWAAVFGVKSNAILLAKGGATLGIGAGQMSRVDASKLAVRKAREAGLELQGSALASDAFFPFRDGVDAAAEAGATTIVQPGGSKRDQEVVQAADEHGMAMVLTGRRLFRH